MISILSSRVPLMMHLDKLCAYTINNAMAVRAGADGRAANSFLWTRDRQNI